MWSLLVESARELFSRKAEVLRTFWFLVLLTPIAIVILDAGIYLSESYPGSSASSWLIAVDLFIFIIVLWGLGVAPAAVRWHRLVIAGERTGASIAIPNRKSWFYAVKLLGFMFGFVFLKTFLESIWRDIIVPIFYAYYGVSSIGLPSWSRWASDVEPVWLGTLLIFAQSAIGSLTLMAIYVLIFGHWFLALPEKSLEWEMQGARNTWTRRESWNFKGALFIVYSCPVIVEAIEYYFSIHLKNLWGYAPIWLPFPTILISFLCALLGLTVLSVAYRQNLQKLKANSSSRSPLAPTLRE